MNNWKEPTEEDLLNPDWWDENAPDDSFVEFQEECGKHFSAFYDSGRARIFIPKTFVSGSIDYVLEDQSGKVWQRPVKQSNLKEEITYTTPWSGDIKYSRLDNASGKIKSDGGSSSYYDLELPDELFSTLLDRYYNGEAHIKTEEIIHYILKDSFIFGTMFKSLVRGFQETQGGGKEGNDLEYEMNKVVYYSNQAKDKYSKGEYYE